MTNEKKVLAWMGIGILGILFVFFMCIISTLAGAFIGWLISLTPMQYWLIDAFKIFGFNIEGRLMEIGALLGFISGFFRGITQDKTKEEDK